MGGQRKPIFVGLAVAMLMGIGIYLKLWSIDYSVSSVDAELLRRQFDLANREAMDESAEWRRKYDTEAEKATNCAKELSQVKGFSRKDVDDSEKLAKLQKENTELLKRVKFLNQQLEDYKVKCKS